MVATATETLELSVDELREMLERNEPVTVLDVRSAADRAEWSIPGSIHIDAYEALKRGDAMSLAGVDLPRDRPVVTICTAGVTSRVAAKQLRAMGFAARTLAGGMNAWSLAWNTAELGFSGPSTTVIQVRRTGKGCLSYIVESRGEALVIDAALDPEVYIELASERGWTIAHVVDTHIHADHLSSSRALAERTGALLHLPAQRRVSFPFSPLADGGVIRMDDVSIKAIATPGHTAESIVLALDDHALFTGDTLFLAGVGRPDLEATVDEARERAHLLYRSLRKIAAISPDWLVLPGHTQEPVPFDGQALAMALGEVVASVDALTLDEEAFVAFLLDRIPPAPPNHALIVSLNETGELPETGRTALEAGANRCAIN